MWCFVLFDLPVKTKAQRKAATLFRKFLLQDGYVMIQYSVYARPCNSNDSVEKHLERLKYSLPANGQVRSMVVTDAQYARMTLHIGKKSIREQKSVPLQLTLF